MSNQEEQGSLVDAVPDVLGCLLLSALLTILLVIFLPTVIIVKVKKHNQKLSEQSHKIEGVVASIEMIDVPPPPTLDEINAQREKEGKNRINFYYELGPRYTKKTRITFEDGREMEFNGVSAKPIEISKYYVITYNGLREIVDFTIGDFQATMNNGDSPP